MKTKVAINGFGRIGRNIFRLWLKDPKNIEIVCINDLMDPKTLVHLLRYDSVHGQLDYPISIQKDYIEIAGKKIKILAIKDLQSLPWEEHDIDMVFECTGLFRDKKTTSVHLDVGAKKVLISSPAKNEDITVVMGVNHKQIDPKNHLILSNGSCTTNCLAPVTKVIHEKLVVKRALMTTIHSYTNDQRILDLPHSDLRRARAAAMSMIPTTTGAAKAIGLVIPDLNGKIDGIAIRVPTPNVSVVDVTFETEKNTSKEEVNKMLKDAAANEMQGILSVSEESLVSTDFNGNCFSSIVDAQLTMVKDQNLVKIFSWYDNETGFSQRMLDLTSYLTDLG